MLSIAIDLMAYGEFLMAFHVLRVLKKKVVLYSTCKRDLKIIDEGVIGSKHERVS